MAVLAVVVFHLRYSALPGGFLGVDVFFVISGFLITFLLATEVRSAGRLRLGRFYARRVRRLLPSVWVLVAVVIVAGLLIWTDQRPTLFGGSLSSLTYVTNWWLISDHLSYFAATGRPTMFQHLWSLAIEEQYYLLWPPVLLAVLRPGTGRRPNRVRLVILVAGALAMASTLLMAVYAHAQDLPYGGDTTRVYFGTDTHSMGLFLGSAGGAWFAWRRTREPASSGPALGVSNVLGSAALVIVAAVCFHVDEYAPMLYRGGYLAFDALVLVVVLCAVRAGSGLGSLLDVPPLRWIGLRSYSIYLWHWPISVVTRPDLDIRGPGLLLDLARLILILGVSAFAYKFVELPLRTKAGTALQPVLDRIDVVRRAPGTLGRHSAAEDTGRHHVLPAPPHQSTPAENTGRHRVLSDTLGRHSATEDTGRHHIVPTDARQAAWRSLTGGSATAWRSLLGLRSGPTGTLGRHTAPAWPSSQHSAPSATSPPVTDAPPGSAVPAAGAPGAAAGLSDTAGHLGLAGQLGTAGIVGVATAGPPAARIAWRAVAQRLGAAPEGGEDGHTLGEIRAEELGWSRAERRRRETARRRRRSGQTTIGALSRPAMALSALTALAAVALVLAGLPARQQASAQIADEQPAPTAAPSTRASDEGGHPALPGTRPIAEPPSSSAVDPKPALSAFGDSVLLGAAPTLSTRIDVTVDAVVGRQAQDVLADIRSAAGAGRLNTFVLIHVGNNGIISPRQLDRTLQALRNRSRVVLVTVRVDRPWQDADNKTIQSIGKQYVNVRVVDWHGASDGHPNWFVKDGLHLTKAGADEYSRLVLEALR